MEVMLVQNSAPKTSPDAKENFREDWIQSLLHSGAWRAKRRSLPLLWLLIVGAFAFPMGLMGSLDAAGEADEAAPAASGSASTPSASAAINTQAVDAEVGSDVQAANKEAVPASGSTPATENATDANALQLPEPPLSEKLRDAAASLLTGTQTMRVRVIVSGKVFSDKLQLPRAATVRNAIEAFDLKLNPFDKIVPAVSTLAYDGMSIRITRVRSVTKTRTIATQPDMRFQVTTALSPGSTKTVQSARSGQIQVAERVWFKDGVVAKRESLGKKVVRAAQDQVIAVGARSHYMPGRVPYHNRYARAYTLASRYGSPRDRMQSYQTRTLRPVRSITLVATGYSPDPSENGGWSHTATGLPIGYGAAAVDPRVIPLGTKMYVEGYGYAFACDTGGAIKGHRIDLAYDSYGEANSKGRKAVRVWILAP
jgi:3D (Asp-Asp-Asp) domain-containing protein